MIFRNSCTFYRSNTIVPKIGKANCDYLLQALILNVIYYTSTRRLFQPSSLQLTTSPVVYSYSLTTTFEICTIRQHISCFTIRDLSAVITSTNGYQTFTALVIAYRLFSDYYNRKCSLYTLAARQYNKQQLLIDVVENSTLGTNNVLRQKSLISQ